MSWLKENWFRLVIILLLLTAIFIFYGYFNAKNEQQKRAYLIERQRECIKETDNLRNRVSQVRSDFELIEAHFNEHQNVCYAYTLSTGEGIFFHIVYDVLRASQEFYVVMYSKKDDGWIFSPDVINGFSIQRPDDIDIAARAFIYAERPSARP